MLIEPHNKCIQGCCTSTFVNSLGYSALGGHEVAPAERCLTRQHFVHHQ